MCRCRPICRQRRLYGDGGSVRRRGGERRDGQRGSGGSERSERGAIHRELRRAGAERDEYCLSLGEHLAEHRCDRQRQRECRDYNARHDGRDRRRRVGQRGRDAHAHDQRHNRHGAARCAGVGQSAGNADYTATAAVFGVGAVNGATANVVVAAVNDLNVEQSTESFAGQALSATSTASVSASTSQSIAVTDNDSASVAITTSGTTGVTEGGGSANVGVTLTLTTSGTTGTAQLDVPVSANLPATPTIRRRRQCSASGR